MTHPREPSIAPLAAAEVDSLTGPRIEAAYRPSARAMMGGSIFTLCGRIAASVFGFISAVLAARLLGPSEFGLYSVALSAALFATIVASAGVDHGFLAILPARRPSGRRATSEVLSGGVYFALAVAVVLTVILVALRHSIAAVIGQPGLAPYLGIMFCSIPFGAMLRVSRAASQSSFAFRAAVLPMSIVQPVTLCLGLVVLTVAITRPRTLVAWVYVLAAALAAGLALSMVARDRAYDRAWLRPRRVDGELVHRSMSFLAIQIFTDLKSSVLLFVLAASAVASEVGMFSAAVRTANLVSFILVAVNMVFAPTISALWSVGDGIELAKVYRSVTRLTIAASFPMCILLALCGPGILAIYGDAYRPAALALALLALGQMVNAMTGSVGYMLMMTGSERTMLVNTIGVTVASAALGVVVGPRFGFVGMAAVQAAVVGGFNLLMLYQVWRRLGLQPFDRQVVGVLSAGAVSTAVGLLLYRWAWADTTPLALGLAVATTLILGSYAVVMAWVGLSPADRKFAAATVGRTRQRFRGGA